ncbi:MAG: TonB-dependent receptor [Bacteroidales bacterium]|nr:TonB-dependent receptor [Bacteroidales bacterium]
MIAQRFSFQRLLLTAAFVLASVLAFAQDNSIKGFVYEESTGEPVMYSSVYLKGTTLGCSTDINGYFNITRVPDGTYTLCITCVGYINVEEKISVAKGQSINKKFMLKEASQTLETVSVTAEKVEARTETKTSVITVTPKTINKIPSIGGQSDLAQYLQVVPGVIFTGDQGGQLYIRGGSPIQNKVLLDGMTIFNPFHSIGLFSVFDTDIIRNAEVYTGGFGAEYGGRISSVMDITTRDGNKKRWTGKVGANCFGAKLTVEGPLKKAKGPDDAAVTYVLSAKNSYLEQSSKVLYNYASETGLPFNYTDIYSKVSLNAPNGSKVNIFGFSFNDKVNNYKSLSDFSWNSWGAGANFIVIPGKAPVMIEGNLAYSQYYGQMKELNNPDRFSKISNISMGFNFNYFLGKNTLKFGIEVAGPTTHFQTYSYDIPVKYDRNGTEIGAFAKYKLVMGNLLLEPSLRLQKYSDMPFSLEPRFAAKYNINDNLRLKGAGGRYTQDLVAGTNDRDVVNLFYGFLSGNMDTPGTFNGKAIHSSLQKANHFILGAEYDLTNNLTMNLEGYWKQFVQLTNLNRNMIYDGSLPENLLIPDLLKRKFMIENGDAYGFDLSFKYEDKHWYLWAVYALGYVNRHYEKYEGGQINLMTYQPHFDRRHNINLILTYTAGERREWEFSGRWNFGSGFPFTQVQAYYEFLNFQEGIFFDFTTANGEIKPIFAELNQGRLPNYHRLDLDAKRKFFFSEKTILEVDLSVTNVYNMSNVFYIDIFKPSKPAYQLPILPSMGLTLTF